MISKNFSIYFTNLKIFNSTYLIILILLLYQIYSNIKSPFKFRNLNSFGNVITMKIKGEGEQTFIVEHAINKIQYLYINNEKKNYTKNKIILENEINEIKIEMKVQNISNLNKFFYECKNIIEIDLSNFNPVVNGMSEMFQDCTSLISVNFGNFNASNVGDMQNMFKNCRNLKYINIHNFDTSQVHNMYSMFSGCNNLVYLNLSNFNLEKVTAINEMFQDCSSLKLLDISNFDKSSGINTNDIFSGTPKDMVIMGEVGLTGEVRRINMIEKRLKEAEKLGYKTCIIPENNK